MPEEKKQSLDQTKKEQIIAKPEAVGPIPERILEVEPELEKEQALELAPPEIQAEAPSMVPPTVAAPTDKEVQRQVKEIKVLDKERQVQVLSRLAFEKGINYAVSVARSLNNAYVLDKLHDTLVDQLYEELVKKGKLKEL